MKPARKKKSLVGYTRSDWRMGFYTFGRLFISLIHNKKNIKSYNQIGVSKIKITIEEI